MRRLFFFFIDGIGLGESDLNINPMHNFLAPILGPASFAADAVPLRRERFLLKGIDAVLGIKGIPQSATGQTSIVTGENASRLLGYHMRAFPNEELISLIRGGNIFTDLSSKGIPVTCANLYSREFLEERRTRHRNMIPVSTLSIESAGLPLRYEKEYREGKALFADISNRFLRKRGYDIPLISPEEGAERIHTLMSSHRFVFFEYFLTDSYGHARSFENISEEVEMLNRFIVALISEFEANEEETDLLITSDHGNAEDNRTGDHTLNPVPLFVSSRSEETLRLFDEEVSGLTDIRGAIHRYFGMYEGEV